MKSKLLILIGIILLACGCSSEVNLTITENNISEEIRIKDYITSGLSKEEINLEYRNYVPAYYDAEIYDEDPDEEKFGVQYYEHQKEELDYGFQHIYKYNFPFKNYKNGSSIKYAFRSYSILKDNNEKTITILTDANGLLYFEQYPRLEHLKLTIKTDMEVVETNGTLEQGVYTWDFYKNDNKKSVYIMLKMNEEQQNVEQNSNYEKENKKNPNIHLAFGILGVFIIVMIGIIIYKIKNSK